MSGRNPTWTTDELILAMDLYVRHGQLDDKDPEVIELSRILNLLPIHGPPANEETFRNGNGVALKLANFAAIDPSYTGRGMARGGRGDREVWALYTHRRDELERLARILRSGAGAESFPSDPEPDEDEVREGRLVYRMHRSRERNRKLVERKKEQVRSSGLPLACEVCGMDFGAFYGELGDGYIECHHLVPLSESGPTTTRLDDLALVCANCHRMSHRGTPWRSIDQLQRCVQEQASNSLRQVDTVGASTPDG